jgi:hypothetical protein
VSVSDSQLPASKMHDFRQTPAVPLKLMKCLVPHLLLDDEVPVEGHRLHAGHERIVGIDVLPAGLDHPDLRVLEPGERLLEEVPVGDEVGVEDRDVFARGGFEPLAERAGLVPRAVAPAEVVDPVAAFPVEGHPFGGDPDGFVRGIVEHLDLEAVLRVIHPADPSIRRPTT